MENLLKYKNLIYFPVLVLISSWVHLSSTHSLKVDGNSIEPIALRFFLFACIAFSFGIYVFNAYKLYFQDIEIEKNELRWLGYLFLVFSVFTLPIFSNDFFSLIGYSDAYLKGYSIYTDPIAPSYSFVKEFINPSYLNLTCKYGPINVLLMNMTVSVVENSLIWSLVFSKLLFGLAGVFYIEFSLKFYAFNKKYSQLLILIPLWYFQGIGQFHNDIFGVLFILIGIYYSIQKPRWYSVVFFVLAALCKFTFIVFLIYPILVLINQSKKIITKDIVFKIVTTGIVLITIGFIVYYPFIHQIQDVFTPYQALNTERPSSSFADISAYAMLPFYSDFKHNYTITISVFKYIGLIMIVLCGINFLRKFKTENYYLSFLVQLFTVIILVYSHRFLPWYLMVMPLFMYSETMKHWIKWFFVILFFSTFQDFAIFLSTDNILGQTVMTVATILTVLSFFYLFKSRYSIFIENEN